MRSLFAIILVFFAGLAKADDRTINDLIAEAPTNPAVAELISVSGESYAWANARLDVNNKPKLYCAPIELAITDDQYVSILKSRIAKNPQFGRDNWALFPSQLLSALIEIFPC